MSRSCCISNNRANIMDISAIYQATVGSVLLSKTHIRITHVKDLLLNLPIMEPILWIYPHYLSH